MRGGGIRSAVLTLGVLLLCSCAAPGHPPAETGKPVAQTAGLKPSLSLAGTAAPAPPAVPKARTDNARVYFLPGESEIDADSMKRLVASASDLRTNPHQLVTVVPFTEDRGSRSYELAIAEEEALTVVGLLRGLGVPQKQIRRSAPRRSATSPDCGDPQCRRALRYVELTIDQGSP